MSAGGEIVRLAARAMATRFELVLAGGPERMLRAAGESALEAIQRTEAELSRFTSNGFVALLNRIGAEQPVRADPELFELLCAVDELRELTGGAYDVCYAGPGGLVLDRAGRRASLSAPGTVLDLGSVGKGVALDRAALELEEAGVRCALLHGGTSTVLALDPPPGRSGFGVRVALEGGRHVDVELCRRALSVSGQHGRDSLEGGGHIADARTGVRASGARIVAATAPRATLADLWSTALLAHGPDAALLQRANELDVRLLHPAPTSDPTCSIRDDATS